MKTRWSGRNFHCIREEKKPEDEEAVDQLSQVFPDI